METHGNAATPPRVHICPAAADCFDKQVHHCVAPWLEHLMEWLWCRPATHSMCADIQVHYAPTQKQHPIHGFLRKRVYVYGTPKNANFGTRAWSTVFMLAPLSHNPQPATGTTRRLPRTPWPPIKEAPMVISPARSACPSGWELVPCPPARRPPSTWKLTPCLPFRRTAVPRSSSTLPHNSPSSPQPRACCLHWPAR
jgi:hypothetical protein